MYFAFCEERSFSGSIESCFDLKNSGKTTVFLQFTDDVSCQQNSARQIFLSSRLINRASTCCLYFFRKEIPPGRWKNWECFKEFRKLCSLAVFGEYGNKCRTPAVGMRCICWPMGIGRYQNVVYEAIDNQVNEKM